MAEEVNSQDIPPGGSGEEPRPPGVVRSVVDATRNTVGAVSAETASFRAAVETRARRADQAREEADQAREEAAQEAALAREHNLRDLERSRVVTSGVVIRGHDAAMEAAAAREAEATADGQTAVTERLVKPGLTRLRTKEGQRRTAAAHVQATGESATTAARQEELRALEERQRLEHWHELSPAQRINQLLLSVPDPAYRVPLREAVQAILDDPSGAERAWDYLADRQGFPLIRALMNDLHDIREQHETQGPHESRPPTVQDDITALRRQLAGNPDDEVLFNRGLVGLATDTQIDTLGTDIADGIRRLRDHVFADPLAFVELTNTLKLSDADNQTAIKAKDDALGRFAEQHYGLKRYTPKKPFA